MFSHAGHHCAEGNTALDAQPMEACIGGKGDWQVSGRRREEADLSLRQRNTGLAPLREAVVLRR
jgi:hypothetical protein